MDGKSETIVISQRRWCSILTMWTIAGMIIGVIVCSMIDSHELKRDSITYPVFSSVQYTNGVTQVVLFLNTNR